MRTACRRALPCRMSVVDVTAVSRTLSRRSSMLSSCASSHLKREMSWYESGGVCVDT